MPHTRSAKKNLRKAEKRRLHNRGIKRGLKKQLKAVQEATKATTPDALKKEVHEAIRKLDKAAARRTLHPNTAARKKSQLARMLTAKTKAAAPATTCPSAVASTMSRRSGCSLETVVNSWRASSGFIPETGGYRTSNDASESSPAKYWSR